jgi:hypothetical protein
MSGLFGGFRDFVQRRAIYLPTAPLAADAGNADRRLLTLRLDTRRLLNQRANQLGLQLNQTQTLMERILSQHDMIIDACRVQ